MAPTTPLRVFIADSHYGGGGRGSHGRVRGAPGGDDSHAEPRATKVAQTPRKGGHAGLLCDSVPSPRDR
eukprot:11167677-Lingulodinium_polyedra.AAC.1